MPFYAFACDKCKNNYEEFRPLGDFPDKCPSCKETYGEHFHQNYQASKIVGWTYGNPTTVGQQAEINSRKAGKEQLQLMDEADAAARSGFTGKVPKGAKPVKKLPKDYVPPWRDGSMGTKKLDKPLDANKIKTKEKQEKYIITGEL